MLFKKVEWRPEARKYIVRQKKCTRKTTTMKKRRNWTWILLTITVIHIINWKTININVKHRWFYTLAIIENIQGVSKLDRQTLGTERYPSLKHILLRNLWAATLRFSARGTLFSTYCSTVPRHVRTKGPVLGHLLVGVLSPIGIVCDECRKMSYGLDIYPGKASAQHDHL